MNKLINIIFKEAGFELYEGINFKGNYSTNFSFFTRTNNNKFDFYLVAKFKEGEVALEGLQDQLDQCFDSILMEISVSGIDKNLSLLLLLETESLYYSKERTKYIYSLEEDPYDFKKYVLTYTKNQLETLENKLNETREVPVIEVLNYLLQEKKLFTSFKKKQEDRSPVEGQEANLYDLVSKLFIKLPFLSVIMKQEELVSLKKEIDEKLNQTQTKIVSLMLEQHSKDPELNINDILPAIGVEYIE
ncbi:ABC-three component system middle component 1 [Rossellomorea aquimaris]|uniref:Uncharacterized protein n=1 Tax=Rossellomorea aquimaris TaxID=189382 RepID=A0A366EQ46_9BACI|nr:ABC-three component system middle component 1 [Rossellomorea aquimaris]RBP04491.1 hypothetical protein DET59_106283 [Rossellomorea aquimaris]